MPAPRKCSDEPRERATRMVVEARRNPATRPGAIARIGDQLGVDRETPRNWVSQAEVDAGDRPGPPPTRPSVWPSSSAKRASFGGPTRS